MAVLDTLYICDVLAHRIWRGNINTGGLETIVLGSDPNPFGVALDEANEKIYYCHSEKGQIRRIDYDGTNLTTLVGGLGTPRDMKLDLDNDTMYWIDREVDNEKLQSSDLDGSNIQVLETSGLMKCDHLAFHKASGLLYWNSDGDDKIHQYNINTSVTTEILQDTNPRGVDIDEVNDHLYYMDTGSGDFIHRTDLDGSNSMIVISGHQSAHGLTVDPSGGKIYWARGAAVPGERTIVRADLDGSNEEVVIGNGLHIPWSFAIDKTNQKLYWTDHISGKIERANLDGSSREAVGPPTVQWPYRIDVDDTQVNSVCYWVDFALSAIKQADTNGTNVLEIAGVGSGLTDVFGICVDMGNSQVYWGERRTPKIQRCNFDGTDVEDIITSGVIKIKSVQIDTVNKKIYWADSETNKIERSDVDGTNRETLIDSGLNGVSDIALDVAKNRMYFTTSQNISSASLDGSNVTIIASGLPAPDGLALKLSGGDVIYWSDRVDGDIKEASLTFGGAIGSHSVIFSDVNMLSTRGIKLGPKGKKKITLS